MFCRKLGVRQTSSSLMFAAIKRRCTISLCSAESKQLGFRVTNKRAEGRGRSFGFLALYDGQNDFGGSSCRQSATVTHGNDAVKKLRAVNDCRKFSNYSDSAQRPPTTITVGKQTSYHTFVSSYQHKAFGSYRNNCTVDNETRFLPRRVSRVER